MIPGLALGIAGLSKLNFSYGSSWVWQDTTVGQPMIIFGGDHLELGS